ncbi:DNA dC-_dU-editing enzyme APOBEC-3G-like isoform X1 [Eptesicus fuscus]|uniref:DNA dC->dU-editing enzyme APOBEC-3G-like isoform X1 n=1 Tax=Eptesicus fuscus TaxID=29078 RepID=UPI0024042011|nr:DNA dC->dU-editing enzyme APOBEC-3G-like isoform X1 [Eptesicus fuscus]
MADNPAPRARPLMDIATFEDNFGVKPERKTYLCYEVEVLEGDTWAPMEERQGFLRNQGADTPREPRRHAELCFLDLFPSWGLDRGKQYRLTWYVSWSPRPDCAPELAAFLRENSHVSLRIFAARIYTKSCSTAGKPSWTTRARRSSPGLNWTNTYEPILRSWRTSSGIGETEAWTSVSLSSRGSSAERGIKHFLQRVKTHHVPHLQLDPQKPAEGNQWAAKYS